MRKDRGNFIKILILAIAVIAISLLVAFGFYIFALKKTIENNISGQNLSSRLFSGEKYSLQTGRNNYWLGAAKPKIEILEFADFDCPLSKNSFSKIREIELKYGDEVKIVFKDFPVYKNSINLAMAGRCAGEQGLFWPMHDKLYQNQKEFDSSKIDEITAIAMRAGVDKNKFKACMSNQKYLADIQKDYADGTSIEASGTPTWLINGYKISGDIPYNTFISLIEELLNNPS